MEGMISDVKQMSVHDGPGIRTTLFLKGCPLRCLWCHNPENLQIRPTLSYVEKLCVGCEACTQFCPEGVHSFSEGIHNIDYSKCKACGKCEFECYAGALRVFGRSAGVDEVVEILLEDRAFYEKSNGGVTFSGGEPLMQSKFLREVMIKLKSENIHIAVDTCGEVPWEYFEDVLPYADMYLYDIKHIDSEAHKRGTGVGNERILENIKKLSDCGAKIEVRTPVIPGYNSDDETLKGIATLLASLPGVVCWRLLPYHSMAKAKYKAIGKDYKMPETEMPDVEYMRTLQASLKSVFPHTYLSSDIM